MNSPLRVLLVEDSPTDAKLVLHALRNVNPSIESERVEDGPSMRAALEKRKWDLIISDWSMPKFDASTALKILQDSGLDLPFVIVSGTVGEEAAVGIMRAGAHDYVLKDKLERLAPAIERELREAESRAARRRAEERVRQRTEALRESEQSLAITLDSIGDAVLATDVDGRVARMNPVAQRLTGWTIEEAHGRPLVEVFRVVDEDTRRAAEDPATRVMREGVVVGLANRTLLLARDGTERPIADSGAPIRDPEGTVKGVVLVFRDQTEQRRTEEVRIKSLELEVQNRQIQESNRLKSEFLANMSHELRTPLNAILGFTQLIRDGMVKPGMPEYLEFLGDILASGRHLLQLINDVLDLAKVEAGKLDFSPEKVNLPQLVGEVVGILRTTAAEKRIRIESHVDSDLSEVVLDPVRLKQVLYNYVSNALKFTPGGGQVMVRAVPEPQGSTFLLEVEDTGIGISAEDIGRLFVEFQQLDAGADKKHSGTGLGLALTKRLVEAQRGTVGVRSTPGKGSTFHAIMPRHVVFGAPLPESRSFPGAHGGVPTVLVIEQDLRDQAILVETLVKAGYAVDTASTGAQALTKCRERTFDAITLDLLLPDMNGLDVLQAIRSQADHRGIPVIVVTVVDETGVTAGFAVHDVLSKPIDGTALVASLTQAGVSPERSGIVLVVDDDPDALKLMSTTLTQLGFQARCVQSGHVGLEIAREAPPLAVVLDLVMPEMDGFEFLDGLRRLPQCRRVPVIVWTVKDLTTDEHARLRAGSQRLVAKGGGSAAVVDELKMFLRVKPGEHA